ncbi:MAG: hypothetical protein HQM04_18300 [Magnetococcales bacterium]|nr:hypothetical protein [Magnetococcales bacterium]MBF0116980.1 hypothetical protein [Magnetococcales bacterium]
MARKALTIETVRTLFALSGNQCAFPGCDHPLIDDGDYVAEICHIEAANLGGERFNPSMTDEERRSSTNLLVLCHRHHKKTNNINLYTVEKLKKIKEEHERQFVGRPFSVPRHLINDAIYEEFIFWDDVDIINKSAIEKMDLIMSVDTKSSFLDLLDEAIKCQDVLIGIIGDNANIFNSLHEDIGVFLDKLGYDRQKYDSVKYYDNPFCNIQWEMLNIGGPNFYSRLMTIMLQIKIHYLFLMLKANPMDGRILIALKTAQDEMKERAKGVVCID